jgi:hypothetical protein
VNNTLPALKSLLESVKTGQDIDPKDGLPPFEWMGWYMDAVNAFHGSQDAAQKVHDALVPEWNTSHAWGNASEWKWNLTRRWSGDPMYSNAQAENAGRARLIAILQARIKQEEASQ